jgi:hypothetical protein
VPPGYERGGIPRHVNGTTVNPLAVEEWTWGRAGQGPGSGVANGLWFYNAGTGAILLSFTAADAAAGIGITVAAGADRLLPAEIGGFYTQSAAAEAFEAVVFLRRG